MLDPPHASSPAARQASQAAKADAEQQLDRLTQHMDDTQAQLEVSNAERFKAQVGPPTAHEGGNAPRCIAPPCLAADSPCLAACGISWCRTQLAARAAVQCAILLDGAA
jgi:Tfp pilus assembly protein FimV